MILFFLLVSLAAGVFSRDIGTLSVTIVSSEYGTGLTKVRYDSSMLSEICAKYDIELKVRFFEDEDFQPIPDEDIDGDLTDVAPGVHTLTWEGSASFSGTFSEEAVIRVLATTTRYDLAVAAIPASGGTATDETDEGPYEKETEISIRTVQNTGYDFTGWQATSGSFADGNVLETTFNMPAVNATVTATFELIDYNVGLTAEPTDGGTVSGAGEYNYGNTVQIEAIPNEGWLFINWTDDENEDAEITTDATHSFNMPAWDVAYTANFNIITSVVTYHLDGGNNHDDNPGEFTINDLDITLEDAEKIGYEFKGWFTEEAFENEVTKITELGDVELWAKFEVITYGITYNLDDGANHADNPDNFDVEDLDITLQDAEKEAYVFEGWFTEASFVNEITEITEIGNVELWAKFETDHCHGVDPPEGYGIVSSSGNCWLDRNLGADRVAQSSDDADAYGYLFQWGRTEEGHQERNSTTHNGENDGLATTHEPDTGEDWDGKFITNPYSPSDWLNVQNDELWQGVDGTNNPCPSGYRLPTEAELDAERSSWTSNNSDGAFGSRLKLPAAGTRNHIGQLSNLGDWGFYWSKTVKWDRSVRLRITQDVHPAPTNITVSFRAYGMSVRCIKED